MIGNKTIMESISIERMMEDRQNRKEFPSNTDVCSSMGKHETPCNRLEQTSACNADMHNLRVQILKDMNQESSEQVARQSVSLSPGGELRTLMDIRERLHGSNSEKFSLTDDDMKTLVLRACAQILPLFEIVNPRSEDPRLYISSQTDQDVVNKINESMPVKDMFTTDELGQLYNLAGRIFANAFLNNYSTELPLSRVLLNAMVSGDTGVDESQLLVCYALEHDLQEEGSEVRDEESALRQYMVLPDEPKRECVGDFIRGFMPLSSRLNKYHVHVSELYHQVCGFNVDAVLFTAFLVKKVDLVNFSLAARGQFLDVLNNEDGMLLRMLRDRYPDGRTDVRRVNDFYTKLLIYWSSHSIIDRLKKYAVVLTDMDSVADFSVELCSNILLVNERFLQSSSSEQFLETLFDRVGVPGLRQRFSTV